LNWKAFSLGDYENACPATAEECQRITEATAHLRDIKEFVKFYNRTVYDLEGIPELNGKLVLDNRLQKIEDMVRYYGFKSLLDVGCRIGLLLFSLCHKKALERGTGLDVNLSVMDKVCNPYKQKMGFKNLTFKSGLFEDYKDKESYDCVIMAEVLEHCISPEVFLERARKFSNRLIMSSPVDSPDVGSIPNSLPHQEHVHLLTRDRVQELIDRTQWGIIEYTNLTCYFSTDIYVLKRLKKKSVKVPVLPVKKVGKKVILYCRVSSIKIQKDLERQKSRLIGYACSKGYDYSIFEEIASGENEDRIQLNKLLDMIFNGEVSHLIIESKDRLARFGYNYIKRACDALKVKIEVLDKREQGVTEDIIALMTAYASKVIPSPVRASTSIKLGMSLLVCDTGFDLIASNVLYHSKRVDFICCIVNNPSPLLLKLLGFLERSVKNFQIINQINEPISPGFQVAVTNEMTFWLKDRGCEWVIPCDDDEFYIGDLTAAIDSAEAQGCNVVYQNGFCYYSTEMDGPDINPVRRMTWRDPDTIDYAYRKAIHKTKNFKTACIGNHWVKFDGTEQKKCQTNLRINHYTYRRKYKYWNAGEITCPVLTRKQIEEKNLCEDRILIDIFDKENIP